MKGRREKGRRAERRFSVKIGGEAAVVADAGDEGEACKHGEHVDDAAKDVDEEEEGEKAKESEKGGSKSVKGDESETAGACSNPSEDGREKDDDCGDEDGLIVFKEEGVKDAVKLCCVCGSSVFGRKQRARARRARERARRKGNKRSERGRRR